MIKGWKLNSYSSNDKVRGDYMVYEIEYPNGYKEHLSRTVFRKLKALEIIEKSGCNLEHFLLIEQTENYEEYDAKFDEYIERKYGPFKFELRKPKEEYELIKETLS